MTHLRALRALVFAGCAALGLGVAHAATPSTTKVEEVVVTAQRRSEVVEKVPMAIAVITPATLAKTGVKNIHDLNQLVAGASVSFAGCCSQPAVRGISTLTTGVGFENNIAIYVDGFYVPDNLSVNGDLANLSSIEVLKGPQGALWGRNATGGAILINTLAPAKHWTGDFEAGAGSFHESTTKGYLSGPLTDQLRFSVAEATRFNNGYITQVNASGQPISHNVLPLKQVTVRTKLEYKPVDWFTATAGYNYANSADARSEQFQFYKHEGIDGVGPLFCIFQCFPISTLGRSTAPYTYSGDETPRAEVYLNEGTLKLVANTPIGDVTSTTGYAHRYTVLNFDFDGAPYDIFGSRGKYSQNTFQQSVNYNINAIKNLDFIVGADYYHDRQRNTSDEASTSCTGGLGGCFASPVGSVDDLTPFTYTNEYWNKLNRSYALYFDGTYHLLPWLSLGVGGRYTNDHTNITSGENGIVAQPPASAHVTFTDFTPRASLSAQIAPRTDVYFTYSQGYRNGGFNPVPPLQTTPFQPEKIKSYEVGFKTAQSWIQYDTSVFYYDYNNLQVGVTTTSNGGTTVTNETLNAKFARLYGWDNNVTIHPIENATIRAGVELLHARYVDFNNYSGVGLDAASGIDVGQTQNLKGQRMIRAPDESGFVGGDYDFQSVFGGDLDASTNVTFTSKAATENASLYGDLDPSMANKERYVDPAYALLNMSLTWHSSNGHYMATVYGRNVTNTHYLIVNGAVANFGDIRGFSEPVSYGFRLGYSF